MSEVTQRPWKSALSSILSAAKNDKLEFLNPRRLERRLRAKALARSRQLTCAQKEDSERSSLILYHAAFSSLARQVDNAARLLLPNRSLLAQRVTQLAMILHVARRMAIHAGSHTDRHLLHQELTLRYGTMAGLAFELGCDVVLVAKEDEVG